MELNSGRGGDDTQGGGGEYMNMYNIPIYCNAVAIEGL